jgi:hypothetical protein
MSQRIFAFGFLPEHQEHENTEEGHRAQAR